MVKFAGYAKRPETRIIQVLKFLGIVVLTLSVLFTVSLIRMWIEKWGERKPVPVAVTTSMISSSTATSTSLVENATIVPKTVAKPIELTLKQGDIQVEKIVFSSELENNAPVDELTAVSIREKNRLYCYTKINCAVIPQSFRHVWLDPAKKIFASIELEAFRSPANLWSYISLQNATPGQWEVEVRTENGTVLARQAISIY